MPTFTVKIPGGRIGSFLAGAAVASVIGGTAAAITSTDYTYSAVKQGRYPISPAAMTPRNDGVDYFINASDLTTNEAGSNCFSTGVNLPQGAIIQSTTTWYQSDASSDLGVFLYRHNLQTGNSEVIANGDVSDNSNTRKSRTHNASAALGTVNNSTFDYSYWACIGTGTSFDGARINYTYKNAGD